MAEPRWLSDEEQQTWRAFLAAVRLLTAELDRLYGAKVSWVETIRNKAPNGNGNGRYGRKNGS